jgi:hypothetical protein
MFAHSFIIGLLELRPVGYYGKNIYSIRPPSEYDSQTQEYENVGFKLVVNYNPTCYLIRLSYQPPASNFSLTPNQHQPLTTSRLTILFSQQINTNCQPSNIMWETFHTNIGKT